MVAVPYQGGRDLSVEYVPWNDPTGLVEHGEVLLAGVDDLLHRGVAHEAEERGKRLERLGIEHCFQAIRRDLDDAELDEKRPFADELCIEREGAGRGELFAEGLQSLLLLDDEGWIRSLLMAAAGSGTIHALLSESQSQSDTHIHAVQQLPESGTPLVGYHITRIIMATEIVDLNSHPYVPSLHPQTLGDSDVEREEGRKPSATVPVPHRLVLRIGNGIGKARTPLDSRRDLNVSGKLPDTPD